MDGTLDSVADWLGRRYAMITECGMFSIGIIVQITAKHVWQQVAVGRFISGLGVGALSAAVPMVCRSLSRVVLIN
jgi:SP family sugar:H+ symporter-like MFS transporter